MMRILLVTEKYEPIATQRDGGSRLVHTLLSLFKEKIEVMQFDYVGRQNATWNYQYPYNSQNRFYRRMKNARFIAKKVNSVYVDFTHVFYVHISMQFCCDVIQRCQVVSFPMFLTPSYRLSGEEVPDDYDGKLSML